MDWLIQIDRIKVLSYWQPLYKYYISHNIPIKTQNYKSINPIYQFPSLIDLPTTLLSHQHITIWSEGFFIANCVYKMCQKAFLIFVIGW